MFERFAHVFHLEPLPRWGQRLFVVGIVLGCVSLAYFGYVDTEMDGRYLAMSVVFCLLLFYLSLYDIAYRLLPDRLVLLLAISGIGRCLLLETSFESLYVSLMGAMVGGSVLFFLRWVSRGGMGLGDVKLSMALGIWLGGVGIGLTLWLAFFIGSLVGIIHLLRGGSRQDHIPFAPALSIGAVLVYFAEDRLIDFLYQWFLY